MKKQAKKKPVKPVREVKEISDKHKISTEYIYRFIKREGIPKRGYKCNKTKD
jgi:hypothetical protein